MIKFLGKNKYKNQDIDPDEIFLDAENLPGFDDYHFEGRLEKPISKKIVMSIGLVFLLVGLTFAYRVFALQITKGDDYAKQSENNSLRHEIIFADRGIIYDRNGVPLAWNETNQEGDDFSFRKYKKDIGLSNLVGYVDYPKKDKAGFYFETETKGVEGLEYFYDEMIRGENGKKIIETDALQDVVSQSSIRKPEHGLNINLTIDADIQEAMFNSVKSVVDEAGFFGGGGILMDAETGEILSLVSYPEYDQEALSSGEPKEKIAEFVNDTRNPFLNRVVNGLYTPGSIVKPFMAMGALTENVITPEKQILSTGSITIPNPYFPDNPSVFTDWKAHGYVDVRHAIAVSSNVYFYEVGGGFKDQEGLGISRIEKYMNMFGFGTGFNSPEFGDEVGTVPNPDWKMKVFNDEWRLGDTYFTSIGQYGFQVTPLQIARAYSSIANGGMIIEPKLIADSTTPAEVVRRVDVSDEVINIVREGMRLGAIEGTAAGLNYPDIHLASKTGTAELGVTKERVNSWTTGFFPYENPRYVWVIVLEKGKRGNLIGGVAASRRFFDWLKVERPDMFE